MPEFWIVLWWRLLAFVAAVVLSLSGCTATVVGTPVAQGEANGEAEVVASTEDLSAEATTAAGQAGASVPPREGTEQVAALFSVIRQVDVCALHDPAAAAVVVGMQPDDLMPGDSLSSCVLQLVPGPRDLPAWRLKVTAGVELSDKTRRESTPETLDGVDFLHLPDLDGDGKACVYDRPMGERAALHLIVRQEGTEAQPKTACQVAKEYLTAVAKYWREPATWADAVSTPALPVATIDPCAGLDAATAVYGKPVRSRMEDPHRCTVYPQTAAHGDPIGGVVSVTVGVDTDPRATLTGTASADYTAVSIAGRPGVSNILNPGGGPSASGTCYVTVVADDKIEIRQDITNPDRPTSYPVIEARSADCQIATKAIEGLLSQLH
ncbi:hypothetical protein UO65_0132 [Actinokineospora spheciospongiae]|uniref:DUF3558 domain-containing protein n=1 Tax=Actinokineospora spheciospongiae TaxID=909613 RepID=W7IUB6_9PSEU|nr:hypothetical protein [Actinokineospora spheciospongiae]EWC64525.1 hypothetical protein UO65_0132 [Actinokineospora spheciospongiae]